MARINKVDVTPGMSWVEVPDCNLRILCGCPPDSVKHLMRRGLIHVTEIEGVPCDTGPNAILLSDVMVQNGAFCNMAEFPVLQMLYRQGMLIPGHPNNTGVKPLLIGRGAMVESQLGYIHRGNYGLISEDEIMEAGVSAEQARAMMRLKLRFTFGRIEHPSTLLDGLRFDDENKAHEIRAGVFITRLSSNRFCISTDTDSVEIDLNLPPFQAYECPYPLGAFQFKREYFSVVHSGEGDGWDIKRPSTGAIVVHQGLIYLVDAGPNLIHSLTALGIGINEIEGIFHTHSHDDHFAGLTTLMQADHRIKYFAAPMVRMAVAKKMAALLGIHERGFASYFDVHDLLMDEWNEVGALEVKPLFSPHPVETTIFLFRSLAAGGYRTYAHFADMVGLDLLESMITDDPEQPGIERDLYDQVARSYGTYADVKKVDIGGGMIHGRAHDFRNDPSAKIILAHVARPLTPQEKKIGSGASFGTVDVLIDSHRDFLARAAYRHLQVYFPSVPSDHLAILVNDAISVVNPETLLIKAGQPLEDILLLLTGQVEMLDEDTDFRAVLSAGALLGEVTGVTGAPVGETYRAISFVQVLKISVDLFSTFADRFQLRDELSRLLESREMLNRTKLFGGVVANHTLNAIAQGMGSISAARGQTIVLPEDCIGLIHSGSVALRGGTQGGETLHAGDHFGEDNAVFGATGAYTFQAVSDTRCLTFPAKLVGSIPNVRWKLFETYRRHRRD